MNKLTIFFITLFAITLLGGLAYTLQQGSQSNSAQKNTNQSNSSTAQPGADATTNASLKITQ
jgi:preprotein translocase subunit SecG